LVGLGFVALALLADISLGFIKYIAFWSTLSVNVLDYLAFSDLVRGSLAPWVCSLGFGLFLRATLNFPERVDDIKSPVLKVVSGSRWRQLALIALLVIPVVFYWSVIFDLPPQGRLARDPFFLAFILCLYAVILVFALFLRGRLVNSVKEDGSNSPLRKIIQNSFLRWLVAIVLLALPFLAYSALIFNLPINQGMFARTPFFFVFLLFLYVVIWAVATPVNVLKAIAISLATFALIASTEITINQKKACARVAGHDAGHIGELLNYSFKWETRPDGSNAVAVYALDSGEFFTRVGNVVPKCARYR
jgi:hypothetical protein